MKRNLIAKTLLMLMVLCLVLSNFSTVTAAEQERVLKKSPAKDAAVVEALEGFKTFSHTSLTGKYSMPEGLVIRESYIKDGKIHIPPSGLYYTIRLNNNNTNPFGENVLYTLGKKYNWVDFSFKQDILANATYAKVGDKVPFGDGSKSLEMTGYSSNSPGFIAPTATFSILKPSGNHYGATFQVTTDPKLLDVAKGVLKDGTGKPSGSYAVGEKGYKWTEEYYGTSVARAGATYLVADQVTTDKSVVKEFGTGAIEFALYTEKEPQKIVLAAGERAYLNEWHVKVVDISNNAATVKLWNSKTNEVLEKVLGPLTSDTTSRIPADQAQRNKFVIRPASNDIQVQLDIYNDPFGEAAKVKLVGFTDIIKVDNAQLWPSDDRFIWRPDT